jgi:hypothetical protein
MRTILTLSSVLLWACEASSPALRPATAPSGPVDTQIPLAAASDGAEPEPEPSGPTGPTVAEVCEALCAQVASLCSEESAAGCRIRCERYKKQEASCGEPIKKALTCQAQTKSKTICVNVASDSCQEEFRRMHACQKGEDPDAAPERSPALELPSEWKRVKDETLRVSLVLPPNAQLTTSENLRTWRGEHEGVTYLLEEQPAHRGALTQAVVLRMVLKHVGPTCQKGLRVHGRYETGDRTSLWFETSCHDGSERRGMMHIFPNRTVVVAVRSPSGGGDLDRALFASFRVE